MPASDISRLSTPRVDTAATIAKQITNLQIKYKLQSGELRRDDEIAFKRAYETIYHEEYYKLYRLLEEQAPTSRIIYLPTDNPAAKKFYCRHSPVRFTKTNLLIRVQNSRVIIGRFKYPINCDKSPETKEVFINYWPGPLDKGIENLKSKITDYIYTLGEHDSDRKIRYCNNDEQRITILKLLTELLNRSGTVSAQVITRLLVRSEQSEIPKDDTYRRPLEILQKYLLLGRHSDAIEYAKSKNLLEHHVHLSVFEDFLNKSISNPAKLEDSKILQATDHFINTLTDNKILNIVYRSFLNKILQNGADSNDIIKYNVGNNAYEFALFSANNLAMDFDQSNEIFKLVSSIKQATLKPTINNHLISLGFVSLDSDNSEDSSFRSHSSFNIQEDTYASRTLRISNIDMLIFNEIWEYCLNLARGKCNPTDYEYIIDLVPYKLIFAAKLFDYGLYDMFANYLYSIQTALTKARQAPYIERDPFYDWNTIEQSVEHLAEIWSLFQGGEYIRPIPQELSAPPPQPLRGYDTQDQFNPVPYQIHNSYQTDPNDSAPMNEYTSLPYQDNLHTIHNNPIPSFNQLLSLQEEHNPFNPDPSPEEEYDQQQQQQQQHLQQQQHQQNLYNQYEPNPYTNEHSNDISRRTSIAQSQSMDMPIFSPPSFGPGGVHERQIHKTMTSSSPVDKNRDSLHEGNHRVGESFNTPYSPINEYNDMQPTLAQTSTNNNNINSSLPLQHQQQTHNSNTNENQMSPSSSENNNANSNNKPDQQQSAGDQQSGFINNIFGMLKKSSSSKQMNLPDDTKQNIIWDQEKGAWVDKSNPNSGNATDQNDAPPIPGIQSNVQPPTYSFPTKSSKSRYPKKGF